MADVSPSAGFVTLRWWLENFRVYLPSLPNVIQRDLEFTDQQIDLQSSDVENFVTEPLT